MKPEPKLNVSTDKRVIALIAVVIIGLVVATIFYCHHMIDSLEDNAKQMHMYHVKPAESTDGYVLDLAAAQIDRPDYQHRHPLACSLYDEGMTFASTNPQKAIAMLKRGQDEYDKDIASKRVKPETDDLCHSALHYRRIAECYLRLKDYREALSYANKSLKVREEGSTHRVRAQIYAAIGEKTLSEQDRVQAAAMDEAERHLLESSKHILLPR